VNFDANTNEISVSFADAELAASVLKLCATVLVNLVCSHC